MLATLLKNFIPSEWLATLLNISWWWQTAGTSTGFYFTVLNVVNHVQTVVTIMYIVYKLWYKDVLYIIIIALVYAGIADLRAMIVYSAIIESIFSRRNNLNNIYKEIKGIKDVLASIENLRSEKLEKLRS